MSRPYQQAPRDQDSTRINADIAVSQVRLIDADNNNHGIVDINKALIMAEQSGLDLVEIANNSNPPVCKILDYGKYKYLMAKRKNEARKKQKNIEVKEIKLRPGIEEHDYQVKLRNMEKFLNEGDKVKVTLRFRGRENIHTEIGKKLLERAQKDLENISKIDSPPQYEGRQMMMVLGPLTQQQRKQLEQEKLLQEQQMVSEDTDS